MCLCMYTKKIFSLETNDVPDQITVKRQMNQGQKMFCSGYFVLSVKALSLCFLYTMINRLRPESFSAVRCSSDSCETLNKVSKMCFAFPKIISLINRFPSKQRIQMSKAALTPPPRSSLQIGRFQRLNQLQMKCNHQ